MKTQRTILSGLLALFVLTSSISHSISIHFCGGTVRSVAVFGEANQCQGHDSACDHQGNTNHTTITNNGCCEDATFKIDSDKYTYKVTDRTVDGPQYIFLPVANLVQEVNPFVSSDPVQFSHYRPPLIGRDITVLVQSFLI